MENLLPINKNAMKSGLLTSLFWRKLFPQLLTWCQGKSGNTVIDKSGDTVLTLLELSMGRILLELGEVEVACTELGGGGA